MSDVIEPPKLNSLRKVETRLRIIDCDIPPVSQAR